MSNNTLIGRRLGNYKIESLIAEGGMSSVYEGVHMLLGRRVAIKQLNPILEQQAGVKERLRNEAVALSKLKHPHIVAIYDYVECELGTFIIEEVIKGTPLNEYIKNESGPIPEAKAIKMMLQMLDSVGYMHSKNIIHRDIKPGNFVITPDGEIKMLDFGIALMLDANAPHITQPGTKVGTALYMSPQQVKGQTLDRRTDIYSLGITFFHMITGQHPYSSKLTEYEIYNKIINDPLPPPSSIYAGISPQMEEVIYKATAKRPLDRYQDCNALRRDLMAMAPKSEAKSSMEYTQVFDITPSDKERHSAFARNAVMMMVVAAFILAVVISLFAFGRQDQMHVIADKTYLYDADSLQARHIDNLAYGETIKTTSDKPEIISSDGTVWIEAVSLRGIKGLVPKSHVATRKIYQQINSMFSNNEAIELTPTSYKQILWKHFVENRFFKNSSSQWKITGEYGNDLEYNGTCSGDYNGNNNTDYACVARHISDISCKVLIFFDETNESISLDYNSEVKIRTIPHGEKGGGWYIGNTYTRTMSNGTQYDVNKYEFLPNDGILIYDVEKETSTVCLFDASENKVHLIEQPK